MKKYVVIYDDLNVPGERHVVGPYKGKSLDDVLTRVNAEIEKKYKKEGLSSDFDYFPCLRVRELISPEKGFKKQKISNSGMDYNMYGRPRRLGFGRGWFGEEKRHSFVKKKTF